MTHVLKVGGLRANFIELPLRATIGVASCLSFGHRVQVTGIKVQTLPTCSLLKGTSW